MDHEATVHTKFEDFDVAGTMMAYFTTETAYLNYLRIPKKHNDRSTAEHETNEELVVPAPAYSNFTQCQKWKDKEPNGCYFELGTELIYWMGKNEGYVEDKRDSGWE